MSVVKLTKKTENILKNFATINKSIIVTPGNKLRTMSVGKNIFGIAKIPEDIPRQVAIYDLGQFLSCLSLHQTPVFDFRAEKKVTVTDQTSATTTTFFDADPSTIQSPPNKEIEMPDIDVEFELRTDTLNDLMRAASILGVPDLCLFNKGENVQLMVCDKKNETSNTFSAIVGKHNPEVADFCYCFKVENIRLMPGDYKVSVAKNKVSHFVSADGNLEYYIALEPS
jgi:hypothetical protein|tara:strand:+ start:13104 stop:13781 length:678 start_codon:yes stop_codon:yes gene_type:complete